MNTYQCNNTSKEKMHETTHSNYGPAGSPEEQQNACEVKQKSRIILDIATLSYLNFLLVVWSVPRVDTCGVYVNYANIHEIACFVVNTAVMIPLARMLGFAADQLSYYLGEVVGGVLIAAFS